MHWILFTYNPKRNDHCRSLTEEDCSAMQELLESRAEFNEHPAAIVVERPDTDNAHMHAVFGADDSMLLSRQKSQEMQRWFSKHKALLPDRWRWGTEACHAKVLCGAQTPEMMVGGYLRKEDHKVCFLRGFDEEQLGQAQEAYRLKACKVINLAETTYMDAALKYRQLKGLQTEDLAEVLAAMEGDGYSIAYLMRKRKISDSEVLYFSKKCCGGLSAEDVKDLLYQNPPTPSPSEMLASLYERKGVDPFKFTCR